MRDAGPANEQLFHAYGSGDPWLVWEVVTVAGRGPAPKAPEARRRRNATEPLTVVVSDGAEHGPALPDHIDWPDATCDWWATWRRSAQAATFTDTDWSFLLDTAVLHMAFWDGDGGVAAELRLRVAKFGATPEDRARLKISVGEPVPTPAARTKSASAKARRTRLLKAVGDGEEA